MEDFLKLYPWEDESHKKAFLGFVQYAANLDVRLTNDGAGLLSVAAYFIKKNTESYEHSRDMVGDQISSLRKEIRTLQLQIKEQKNMIGALTQGFKLQAMTMREMAKPRAPGAAPMFASLPPHPNDKA